MISSAALPRSRREQRFKRTELRDAVLRAIAAERPRWRTAEPAELEIWILEYQRTHFISGRPRYGNTSQDLGLLARR